MIYLIAQITFIFLTQIYYNTNLITLSLISSQEFTGTLRLIFANCFWWSFFVAHKKMHNSEYIGKTRLNPTLAGGTSRGLVISVSYCWRHHFLT